MSSEDVDLGQIASRDDLERTLRALTQRVDELEADLAKERAKRRQLETLVDDRHQNLLEDIVALEDAIDEEAAPDPGEQPTTIQTYAAIPEPGREALGDSDRRAAYIYDRWNDWRRKTPSGKAVLSTSTERDGSSRLLPLLREATGEADLRWTQVYRAMERVAKLSGGDPDCLDDGAFEYKPDWSDPWGDGETTVKALILQRPELLQPSGDDP